MRRHWWARRLLGDYSINRIYTISCGEGLEVDSGDCHVAFLQSPEDLTAARDAAVRETASFLGEESYGLGAWVDEELVAACFIWTGERYRHERRDYWPLRRDEAKLVQMVTAGRFRGRGIATQLCRQAPVEMGQRGFARLFARVWHSNQPSIRAFEKAAWKHIALVVEVDPFRIGKPWRFVRRTRSNDRSRAKQR